MDRITNFTDGEVIIYETDGSDANDGAVAGKLSKQLVSEASIDKHCVTSLIVGHFINLYQFIHEDNCGTAGDRKSYRMGTRFEMARDCVEELTDLNREFRCTNRWNA